MVDHGDITRPEPRLQQWGTAHLLTRFSAHVYMLFGLLFSLLENDWQWWIDHLYLPPIHKILCRNRYAINPDCKCLSFCFLLICFHSSYQCSWLLFKFWIGILSISKEDIPVNIILNGSRSWFNFYLSFRCFALLEIERSVLACQCYLI